MMQGSIRRAGTADLVIEDIGNSALLRGGSRLLKGSGIPKPSNLDGEGLCGILWHPLSLLLFCQPVGIASYYMGWGDTYTFWFNFMAMVPLAKILGDATEELAAGLKNDMLAGLLNATFGNAVEMVIMIQTLRGNLFDIVKASLLGSVLSNTLLVLGMSFFFGGIVKHAKDPRVPLELSSFGLSGSLRAEGSVRGEYQEAAGGTQRSDDDRDQDQDGTSVFAVEKVQVFPVLGALVNTSMLLVSCLSFSLVTVFRTITKVENETHEYMDHIMLPVSRICSLIIMSSYLAYIIFQLVTHKEAMQTNDGGDEEEAKLTVTVAVILMFVATALVAYSSELLVRAIGNFAEEARLSMHFIGIILLPIVGNACEHVAAIRFAMKDKPGLAIGIAIGSSTQIALFVVPMSVIAGWFMEKDMDLNFGALNTTVMTLSVVVVLSMVVDGQSNWLQGYLLCSAYAVISVLYFYLPNTLQFK